MPSMESTVYCVKSAEKCQKKCRKQQKTREIADFSENRGFGPKSRNLLRPWNRDFLEGQTVLPPGLWGYYPRGYVLLVLHIQCRWDFALGMEILLLFANCRYNVARSRSLF